MKFILIVAVVFGLSGPAACSRQSTAAADPPPTEESTKKQSAGTYFEDTYEEAKSFVQTEDPQVWMRALHPDY